MRQFKIITIITALLLSMAQTVFSSNEGNVLMVELKSGQTLSFSLSTRPIVTFDGEKVYINATDFSATYSDVKKLFFLDEVSADVDMLKDNKADIKFTFTDGRTAIISGIKKNTKVSVFSLDGKIMPLDVERGNNSITIKLGSYPNGNYIIRCNNNSYKVSKR